MTLAVASARSAVLFHVLDLNSLVGANWTLLLGIRVWSSVFGIRWKAGDVRLKASSSVATAVMSFECSCRLQYSNWRVSVGRCYTFNMAVLHLGLLLDRLNLWTVLIHFSKRLLIFVVQSHHCKIHNDTFFCISKSHAILCVNEVHERYAHIRRSWK